MFAVGAKQTFLISQKKSVVPPKADSFDLGGNGSF